METISVGEGDLIFTGTPEGVGQINNNDKLTLYFNEQPKGSFKIQL